MDTKLFVRKQAGGMFSIVDREINTGNIFWVGSTVAAASDAAGFGLNPDAPFATWDYAIGQCTASQGDRIFLLPGHAENLTVATSVNLDVAGVRTTGLGWGPLKPTFSTTAAAGSITVGAANCMVEGIRLVSNFATGTTIGLTIAAAGDGFIFRNNEIRETANTSEFLTMIAVATTVTDLLIEGNSIIGLAGGSDVNAIIFAGTSADCVILNNYIFGDFSGDVIDHNAGVSVNLVCLSNKIINLDTGAAGDCISVKSDGTGYAADNYGFYNKVDATVFTGAAMVWDQNSANNTLASSGIRPHPAAVAAVP